MFSYFAYVALVLMACSLLGAVVLLVRSGDELTRAVVSDMCFYPMVGFYLVWAMLNDVQIAYEIVLLAALVGGVLPTMSLARIISKGRR